jgi:hypothetical protein
MIEEIDVRKSDEWCYSDSFLGELSENIYSVTFKGINTERSFSLSCEYLHDIIIISAKDRAKSAVEEFWEHGIIFFMKPI